MGFQDVAFLPNRSSFATMFPQNCCRGESLRTTTCLKTVFGVSKGMLPVKYVRSTKLPFAPVKFPAIISFGDILNSGVGL